MTKESRLRSRTQRNTNHSIVPPANMAASAASVTGAGSGAPNMSYVDTNHKGQQRDFDQSQDYTDDAGKIKHNDNPFIEPSQTQTVVDMKDVMVLNDIIEQAAGRHSRASDHGGPLCVPLCSFVHFVNTAWFHPGRTTSGPVNHLYEPSAFRWTVLNRQAVTVIPANPNPGLFRRSPWTPSKPVARHQAQEGRERLARSAGGASTTAGRSSDDGRAARTGPRTSAPEVRREEEDV
ncbi:voltage-gated sodium channel [Culex quinquefasciatus]|uniref:Voltage-gated sodium channel n=1 Tax=Culex quinquefasciatus TaxID=7176 RepID=B0XG22_CULQU|nr:voltage-gated sodium channel [Culex quinquefasciatus]|eukprot:XP_001868594.1 voltage-gated sodium channel [Culex quinquefasciatus]